MSDSVRPHRRQPTRLPRPWDSPGKNTGVGCNFLLQCMKVKSESEVAQSYLTLSNPMDCSPPPSTVWITTNCGKFLEMGIPEHLTCLLRNLYAGHEAIRTRHGITDWFQIGKRVRQGCILSPCLF